MKKLMLALVVAVVSLGAMQPVYGSGIAEKLVFYLPNRVVDLLDTFSVNVGFGPTARIELMGTRLLSGGVGIGAAAMLYKDCNRQYGYGLQNGWNWEIPGLMEEDTERSGCSRLVQNYWETYFGPQDPGRQIYDYWKGPRDYWQIGGSLGCLVVADLYIHPVELADLALGFLLIDIKDDDLTFESFD